MPRYIQFDPTASFTTNVPGSASNASDVSLYLPFDSNINDASANGHSGTASGSATISNTQAKFGSYSLSLNGTSQYVTFANNADFQFGSGDFTIEMFIYMTSNAGSDPGDRHALVARRDSSSNRSFHVGIQLVSGQQKLQFSHTTGGSGGSQTNYDTDIQLNTWTHIAIVRSGSKVFAFVDGVKNSTSHSIGTDTIFAGTSNLTVGHRVESSQYFPGYIDDLRITKGFALYQTSFVPPSQAVGASLSGTNVTNSTTDFTSLKLNLDSNFTDTGPSNHSMTANGNTQISTAQKQFGAGSALFDGNGDYLSTPASSDFAIGSEDFTVSLWYYPISEGPTNGDPHYSRVFNFGNYWNNTDAVVLMDRPVSGNGKFVFQAYSISTAYHMYSTTSVSNGQWYHLQVCRSGSTLYLFVNGNLEDTYTTSVAITTSANVAFHLAGAPGGSGAEWSNSYIDDVLVLKGYALHTSSFTPPASSLSTTVSQTRNDLAVLYMPFDDGLEDKARNHAVTANGNAAISATQAKFGGKSLFIDATGDYLTIPNNGDFNFGNEDFTISVFIRPDDVDTSDQVSSVATILDNDSDAGTSGAWFSLHQKNAGLTFSSNNGQSSFTTSDCLSAATWHHVAVSRVGSTTTVYCDGVSVGSTSTAGNFSDTATRNLYIGKQNNSSSVRRFDGYIDDLLIVKGFGMVFTSAPTSASGGAVDTVTSDTRTYASVFSLRSQYTEKAAGNWPT